MLHNLWYSGSFPWGPSLLRKSVVTQCQPYIGTRVSANCLTAPILYKLRNIRGWDMQIVWSFSLPSQLFWNQSSQELLLWLHNIVFYLKLSSPHPTLNLEGQLVKLAFILVNLKFFIKKKFPMEVEIGWFSGRFTTFVLHHDYRFRLRTYTTLKLTRLLFTPLWNIGHNTVHSFLLFLFSISLWMRQGVSFVTIRLNDVKR